MKTLKIFFIILSLGISSVLFSCEKDPVIREGTYIYENQHLSYINSFPVSWRGDISDEVKETVKEILNSFVKVEGGSFVMGSNDSGFDNEGPAHIVYLSDFYLSKVTVTQKQWKTIMGENVLWTEKYGKGDKYPANYVSYDLALLFIENLNIVSGLRFRMPTEAEWEYAACGGANSHGYTYSGSNNPDLVAWSGQNANAQMHISALLHPNELGLYDMSGNLWEWCSDYYGEYFSSTATNPTGPYYGDKHVLRGGSFTYEATYSRCKTRNCLPVYNESLSVGLRLAMDADN